VLGDALKVEFYVAPGAVALWTKHFDNKASAFFVGDQTVGMLAGSAFMMHGL